MPDYTVSGDVDSMLRSANDAAIRSAIGVGTTDAPTFLAQTLTGTLTASETGTSKNPAVAFPVSGSYAVGIWSPAQYTIQFAMAPSGNLTNTTAYTGLQYEMTTGTLSWGKSTSQTIKLVEDASGILAQRNGVNAQAFRVANQVGASPLVDYDRGVFDFKTTTNTLRIGTENGGTYTTARPIDFVTGGVVRMSIGAAGGVTVSGDLIGSNSVRIGSGAGQVSLFVGGSGILRLVDTSFADFGRIQLGGTTSAFPAIKRNGAGIDIALADDSGLAGLSCALFNAAGIVNAAGSRILWAGRSAFSSPSDGVVRVTNNGSTGFTRLELGEADMGIMRGAGTPEGAVTAKVGSIFLRTDGGASTTLYVKESSPTPSTGWVAK